MQEEKSARKQRNKKYIQDTIRAEITQQMSILKSEYDAARAADADNAVKEVKRMKNDIIADVYERTYTNILKELDKRIRLYNIQSSNIISADVDKKIAKINGDNAIVSNKSYSKEIISNIKQEVCSTVYQQVVNDINVKILPKIENMVQWVNYSTRDGGEIVDSYRRAVDYQANEGEIKYLTDKADKRIISAHVRTMFSEDD